MVSTVNTVNTINLIKAPPANAESTIVPLASVQHNQTNSDTTCGPSLCQLLLEIPTVQKQHLQPLRPQQ